MKRREFIDFLGKTVLVAAVSSPILNSCEKASDGSQLSLQGVKPNSEDKLILMDGLNHNVLISYNDKINDVDTFGFNNDYLAIIPLDNPDEAMLWINHEYVNPLFVSSYTKGEKSKSQVDTEMYNVGGTVIKIKKRDGVWYPVFNDPLNKRITAFTRIPFNWDMEILNSKEAMGTLQNCAGGTTPWGTILTCEENYDYCYGERNRENGEIEYPRGAANWHKFYNNPPEHYGWVVEVDPKSGKAMKHVALGRCAHECATVVELEDKRLVVYTGDDKRDECLYKFISSKPGSLKSGTLYVADLKNKKWQSLDYEKQSVLKEKFKNQTEVLTYLREAAKLVGGTELDRPEDIQIDPVSGDVFIALTNNKSKGNYFGSILKISEDGAYDSLRFNHDTYLTGGKESGFACPDNLVFDPAGNLWFTSDISGSAMNKKPYETFKNNGLFLVLRTGSEAGKVIQVASAPRDAEFTGPCFSSDGKALFLSVQHPGERSKSLEELSSNWPDGNNSMPRPSVVTISGKILEKITGAV